MTQEVNYSVSECQHFMRCRLAWDFTAASRQALHRVGSPRIALQVGTLVHYGIASFIQGKDAIPEMLAKAGRDRVELEGKYRAVVGAGWSPSEAASYDEVVSRAMEILENYFDKWGLDPIPGYKYLPKSVELTFKIPALSWEQTQGWSPHRGGLVVNLCGTFDAIAIDDQGKAWIVDHKTYSQRPSNKDFSQSFQFLTYQWAAEKLFGLGSIGGFIYDGISSKSPDEPEVLKNGRLSKNKACKTTPAKYRRALERLGLREADYADFLAHLESSYSGNVTDWHYRQIIPFNTQAMRNHETFLVRLLQDMANNPSIYPNMRWEGCWDCGIQDLCQATMNGEDVEYLKRSGYQREEASYGTLKALQTQDLRVVNSLKDLE